MGGDEERGYIDLAITMIFGERNYYE